MINTLEMLFSPGSHLSDVPPLYEGMPLRLWQRLMIEKQCSALPRLPAEECWLSKQKLWSKPKPAAEVL